MGTLETNISDEVWQSAVLIFHSTYICIRHGLLQFKVIHRDYTSVKADLQISFPDLIKPVPTAIRIKSLCTICFGVA